MGNSQFVGALWNRCSELNRRIFKDRQILIRTDGQVAYMTVGRRLQMGCAAAAFAFSAWSGYATFSFVNHEEILAHKDAAIESGRVAYSALLADVTAYQEKFNSVTSKLEENHGTMLNLVEQNATLQQNLKSVKTKLSTTETERRRIVAAREELKGQLYSIETEMRDLASRNYSLRDNLNLVEGTLGTALAERNMARLEGSQLRTRVRELETELADLHDSEKDLLLRLTEHTVDRIEGLEKVVELTGVEVDQFIGEAASQGGPFIAAPKDDSPQEQLRDVMTTLDHQINRWNDLKSVMFSLPLTSPLDSYYISSTYGKRRDPKNGKWAMHYGLDMATQMKAKVFATAPGTVIFAGWKGRYGKLIEIDHGNGVITKFGHLHSVSVKKGQKVNTRDVIGLVGNTGRSTGPHVHYEIKVNKKTVNPLKFIKAGRDVFKG